MMVSHVLGLRIEGRWGVYATQSHVESDALSSHMHTISTNSTPKRQRTAIKIDDATVLG